jgi:hypothetical protein
MFHLIGVAHRVQSKKKGEELSADQKEYVKRLGDAIKTVKPALVAEEFSEHALQKLSKDNGTEFESITRPAAESCDVKYRGCDPDDAARKKIGYLEGSDIALRIAMSDDGNGLSNAEINDCGFATEVAKYWPLREAFWLGELRDVLDKEVVFVCGDGHIESFRELLKRNKVDSDVLHQGIGVSQRDAEFWRGVIRYLQAHPELSR